jgi:UDP-glucuronate 4-epimerase
MLEGYKELNTDNTYLITGGAGFIGFHLCKALLEKGCRVIGFDNLNSYYDVNLKHHRLELLNYFEKYSFIKGDLANKADVDELFEKYHLDVVVNLGAQAGVRYSMTQGDVFIVS